MKYRCVTCGGDHEELPHLHVDYPDLFLSVPERDRAARVDLTSDLCVIDGQHFFARGIIEIPVVDHPPGFGFGVWISLKKENFMTYFENFESDKIGPFFGWLCTNLRHYKEGTQSLKTMAHFRGSKLRPRIDVAPTQHPLALDQRNGIALARAWEIVHFYGAK